MKLGEVFSDTEVARVYSYRAPYPDPVFALLRRLLVEPRSVLDAGAGTGALARGMLSFAARVDAQVPPQRTLARIRLGDRSSAFDEALRAVFARHRIERVRHGVVGLVTWGRPR